MGVKYRKPDGRPKTDMAKPLIQTRNSTPVGFHALNEQGYRIGETHHNATILDAVVVRIRDMHELEGKTYPEISKLLGIPLATVKAIGAYKRRAQTARTFRPKPKPKA